ncbi:TBC1 domain family member 5 [Fulvia fulva]|uniref:TBC1 domain family member 5 n=1 Tax=Passalora fulva TaxID=5499 RepID=A0A9Q8L613_PASFU|nr:TBC1 domain family member 5 [Fulvia fulva]KAK4636005.1 TBC1 domain family member 5 [Fulvia fulva]KAK4636834.1 TBC1 domain family member 5 [Fulvia fulva]UJO11379.1 TBC1 domain family member 5 [Fulvia fulva]WPV08503.1 TBC1 domain family member 5 [Fulvia fulva]WPV24066.1 TBC1 domain family member 5 [Fulvia fulva]
MRSLEEARACWPELQRHASLRDLKDAVRLDGRSSIATNGLRSACWKAFLLFDSVDVAEWQKTLAASRSAYNSLKSHFFRYIDNPDDVGTGFDPLSQETETSPWSRVHKDEELRAEILQDVERCMPESAYFRQLETQRTLTDILFVFCKLNPDVSYRQGMHELAAPILWVVENDAVDIGEGSKTLGQDSTIKALFDADHIEHDTFALFGQVMQSAKTFYLSEGPVSIASRSRHIFSELLPQVDPDLVKHLEGLDIVPQVFLIRWIRLLFGREFEFEDVLSLWDIIFAEDNTLEMVDYVCLAMLLRIRWHLLDADYNNALGLLLKYPEQDKEFPAQTLGLDALYLESHLSKDGGSYLVLKYTGRPLASGRPSTPPALQRNITAFSGVNAIRSAGHRPALSPSRAVGQSRNIEAILQSTAKNIYARGGKLGIGKAVRSAVDEVHKKAQEMREAQTPSPPPWRRPNTSDPAVSRVLNIELRNKKLSGLLAGAVGELWEYQRLVTENGKGSEKALRDETVEKLSTAIAKVQFVQVYLDQPTLALPEDDVPDTTTDHEVLADRGKQSHTVELEDDGRTIVLPVTTSSSDPAAVADDTKASALADPSTFEGFSESTDKPDSSKYRHQDRTQQTLGHSDRVPLDADNTLGSPVQLKPRPRLDQSSFSFMLGQEKDSETPARAAHNRNISGGSLFGENERSTKLSTNSKETGPASDNEDFDLGSLRRARGAKK